VTFLVPIQLTCALKEKQERKKEKKRTSRKVAKFQHMVIHWKCKQMEGVSWFLPLW